jgi:hypothetical protein
MTNPHAPEQKGNDQPVVHGGRPDADHEKEVKKAECGHSSEESKENE